MLLCVRKLSAQKDKEQESNLVSFPNGIWPFRLLFQEGNLVSELGIKSAVSLTSFLRKLS